MNYCGIDLHSNNCLIVVIDDHDKVLLEKRVPNDLAGILKLLAAYQHNLAGVVVESTCNWYWLVDGLMEAGYQVKLANPSAIKKYEGLKHSGDEADARYLTHLLRLGILPTGYPATRAARDPRPGEKAHATGAKPNITHSGRREHHSARVRQPHQQQPDQATER
jgi:transposase